MVYFGVMNDDYVVLMFVVDCVDYYVFVGISWVIIVNCVLFVFGLCGLSVMIDFG